MIVRRERTQPFVGGKFGGSKLKSPVLIRQPYDLLVERGEAVTFARDFEPHHQRREAHDRDRDHQDCRKELRWRLGRPHAPVHCATLSMQRSRALRARGLEATSRALARITLRLTRANPPARANSRIRSLTARSSSEWYEMTAILPPTESSSGADLRKAARLSISRFTAIRSA